MTYVMGNICGRYEKYKQLLSRCDLRSRDELYITGDMVGDGTDTLKLLFDMSMRSNVFPVLGEREYEFLKLARTLERIKETSCCMSELLRSLRALEHDEREALLEYVSELPLYEELEVGDRNYLVIHARYDEMNIDKTLSYAIKDIPWQALAQGRIILSGHTACSDRISRDKSWICMNCGERKNLPLAMLCLDDGREYYA